jgi:nucleotide-binding universal stress UspA family protein
VVLAPAVTPAAAVVLRVRRREGCGVTGTMSPAAALVAYDGSAEARAAVREAAGLFPGRLLLIATVWEPGLATLPLAGSPGEMSGYVPPDPSAVIAVDQAMASHATELADDGVRIAREAGATAEPVAVADELDPATTLASIAETRDAAVIVVGSRGLSGISARLHGSTTQKLLRHTRRPILIVRTAA